MTCPYCGQSSEWGDVPGRPGVRYRKEHACRGGLPCVGGGLDMTYDKMHALRVANDPGWHLAKYRCPACFPTPDAIEARVMRKVGEKLRAVGERLKNRAMDADGMLDGYDVYDVITTEFPPEKEKP